MTVANDDFQRTNETPLATPWVSAVGGGANLASFAATSTASTEKHSYYQGTWGNDQECTGVVSALVNAQQYASLDLRFDATSGGNGFTFFTDGQSGTTHTGVASWTNGSETEILAIATTVADGDTIRFTVSGQSPNIVLTVYKNGSQVGQVTGQSGKNSGNPGLGCYGVATVDTWSAMDGAANFVTVAHLD